MQEFIELIGNLKTGEDQCVWPGTRGDWSGSNRILIIEGRALFGEMLGQAIQSALGDASIQIIRSLNQSYPEFPQIVIFNFMQRGAESQVVDAVVGRIRSRIGDIPLVIITDEAGEETAEIVHRHNIRGWIAAPLGFDILVAAIRIALSGGAFLPDRIDGDWSPGRGHAIGLHPARGEPGHSIDLTERESEVLGLIRKGKSNKLISFELGISQSTAKVHISNLMRKLHVHNRTQVAMLSQEPLRPR